MPIPVTCPSCGTVVAAPDAAAGKRAKCRNCQTILTIPIPDAMGFEILDDTDVPAKLPPIKAFVPAPVVLPAPPAFDLDEPPAARTKAKKRVAADDGDERPRGHTRDPEKKGNVLVYILGAALAVLLILIVGGVGVWYFFIHKPTAVEPTYATKPKPTVMTKSTGKAPPKDWETVDDSDFQALLPKAGILEKDDGRIRMIEDYPDLGEARLVTKIVRTDPLFIASVYVIYIQRSSLAKANKDHKATLAEWSNLFLIKVADVDVVDFANAEFGYKGRQYSFQDELKRKHYYRMFLAHDKFYVLHVVGEDINERSEYVKVFFDSFNPAK